MMKLGALFWTVGSKEADETRRHSNQPIYSLNRHQVRVQYLVSLCFRKFGFSETVLFSKSPFGFNSNCFIRPPLWCTICNTSSTKKQPRIDGAPGWFSCNARQQQRAELWFTSHCRSEQNEIMRTRFLVYLDHKKNAGWSRRDELRLMYY